MRASKLQLRNVDRETERKFLDDNHEQGYCQSSICYGLYDGDDLVQVMSFGYPRYTRKYDYELIRLCTKQGCQVQGGASRLLKAFSKDNPGSIVSYCNRDKFSGNVYHSLGFKSLGVTRGYHYEKDGIRYHRSTFTKGNCLKKWPEYIGTDKTEREIMSEQGYTRIEDSIGQETFILNDNSKYYIYEIEINGYHYIGQHKYRDNVNDNYYGSGTILKRFQNKYHSLGNKKVLIDNIVDQETANKYEKCAIFCSRLVHGKVNENGKNMNISAGGSKGYINAAKRSGSGMSGKQHSEETKQKMSVSGKGKHNHKGENNPRFGKHWSEEQRIMLSNSHKGQVPWNKGIKRTDLKDTIVLYESPNGERKSRQEWSSLGIDVYYHKYKRLGRLRDLQ